MKNFFIFLSLLCVVACEDYSNFKLYKVHADDAEKVSKLKDWEFKEGIDFWTRGGTFQSTHIMVAPEMTNSFINFLESNQFKYELSIENVESVLQSDKIARTNSRAGNASLNSPNFSAYWSFNEMEAFIDRLARDYPNLVTKDVIGQSIEGRNIYGVKISKNAEFGLNPIIFIDAGTHAREWAGIQSAFYFLHQIVENSTISSELTENLDFVFVPMVNPDGYVYSFTEDRLWRKNRRYVNYTCTGIDLNRNYAYMWRYVPNSCSSNGYPGSAPLSEPEIYANANYMMSFKHNLRLYLSTHTCGDLVLWPFGFEFIYIKNHKEHDVLGRRFADAIREKTGKVYRVGNSADILYTANGASDDFAVAYANSDFAYTLELTCGSTNGFIYPQDMIKALVEETFVGYRQMALYIKERFNYD